MFQDSRKQQEISHYNTLAKQWQKVNTADKWQTDVHHLKHNVYSSYTFWEKLIAQNCQNKTILDYGCGTGIHSLTPIKYGAKEVIGIDLSEESLKIAHARAQKENVQDKIKFLITDCEQLQFPDNYFDLILDSGTFSSLDLDNSLPELARVLKPDGKVIGIETLGHNPLTNLKRKLNVWRGVRTNWATSHIFKVSDFYRVSKYFNQIQVYYFHLFVIFVLPFQKIPGMTILIKTLNKLDQLLLKIPILQKYGFKIVFEFSKPKKNF